MSEDAERNAFEGLPEFVADQALLQRQWDGKSYVYTRVQGMWDGWQAKAAQAETAQAAPVVPMTQAAQDVLTERRRQIEAEGYDASHDDEHVNDEIAAYAALYAMPEGARDWDASMQGYAETLGEAMLPNDWTMPDFGDDRRVQLVKAGALILAEIERIDRATPGATHGNN